MSFVKRFEDIQAWQEARRLCQQIYCLSTEGGLSRDYGLRDQLRRAAISPMANIAEGFDCDSGKEFARFLGIARRSVVEVQSLLYIALDAGHITKEEFDATYALANKTKALIGGFMHALNKRLD